MLISRDVRFPGLVGIGRVWAIHNICILYSGSVSSIGGL